MEQLDEIIKLTKQLEVQTKDLYASTMDFSREQDLIDLQKAELRDGNFKN